MVKRLLLITFLLVLITPTVSHAEKFQYKEILDDGFAFVPYYGIIDSEKDTATVTNDGALKTTASINGDVILDTESLQVKDADGHSWDIRKSDLAGKVFVVDTGVKINASVALPRDWNLNKNSDTVDIGKLEEAVKRAWNLEFGSDTVATYMQNQDTDVAIVRDDVGLAKDSSVTDTQPRKVTNQDTDFNITNELADLTVYDQLSTAERLTDFNLQANSGLSLYRDRQDTTDGGAILDNTQKNTDTGYYIIRTSDSQQATAKLETRRTGQYVAGATSIYGVGFHKVEELQGSQTLSAGAFTDTNGIGLTEDTTGVSLFFESNDNRTEISQQSWNKDTLDGDCDGDNPSCMELNTTTGTILEIYINYYGEGPTEWKFLVGDTETGEVEFVTAHAEYGENMIVDNPNLPVAIDAKNNGESDTFQVALGGRQYSIEHGNFNPIHRDLTEEVFGYTLSVSEGEWEPIMSVRKEDRHNGLSNTIRASFREVEVLADQDVALRVTIGGTTSLTKSDYTSSSNAPADESIVETYNSQDFTAGEQGAGEIITTLVASGKNTSGKADERSEIVILRGLEFVVWLRPLSGQTTNVNIVAKWEEWW